MARDAAAAKAGLQGRVVTAAGGPILQIENPGGAAMPNRLTLNLYHATRRGADKAILLVRVDPETYRLQSPLPSEGMWNAALATSDWRLTGRLSSGDGTAGLRLMPRQHR